MGKIQSGYGGLGGRSSGKKGLYGGRSSGKKLTNGGFNFQPTVTFESISEEDWDRVFPNSYKPKWMTEDDSEE